MINPGNPLTINTANLPQELMGQPFRWFRLLTVPQGAIVSLSLTQDQRVSPYFIVNPGDWLELKDPATASRIQSTVTGSITYQWSLDDVIRSSPESAALTAAPANVPIVPVVPSGYLNVTVPDGSATLALVVPNLSGIQTVTVRDESNGGGRWLPMRDKQGAAYMRAVSDNTSNAIGNNTIFYIDVAGCNKVAIYAPFPVQISGTFSVAPLASPPKMIVLYALDLGLVNGTSNFSIGVPLVTSLFEIIGARILSALVRFTTTAAMTFNVSLDQTYSDGTPVLGGYNDIFQYPVTVTGAGTFDTKIRLSDSAVGQFWTGGTGVTAAQGNAPYSGYTLPGTQATLNFGVTGGAGIATVNKIEIDLNQ